MLEGQIRADTQNLLFYKKLNHPSPEEAQTITDLSKFVEIAKKELETLEAYKADILELKARRQDNVEVPTDLGNEYFQEEIPYKFLRSYLGTLSIRNLSNNTGFLKSLFKYGQVHHYNHCQYINILIVLSDEPIKSTLRKMQNRGETLEYITNFCIKAYSRPETRREMLSKVENFQRDAKETIQSTMARYEEEALCLQRHGIEEGDILLTEYNKIQTLKKLLIGKTKDKVHDLLITKDMDDEKVPYHQVLEAACKFEQIYQDTPSQPVSLITINSPQAEASNISIAHNQGSCGNLEIGHVPNNYQKPAPSHTNPKVKCLTHKQKRAEYYKNHLKPKRDKQDQNKKAASPGMQPIADYYYSYLGH